jgi:hypothetical protein
MGSSRKRSRSRGTRTTRSAPWGRWTEVVHLQAIQPATCHSCRTKNLMQGWLTLEALGLPLNALGIERPRHLHNCMIHPTCVDWRAARCKRTEAAG